MHYSDILGETVNEINHKLVLISFKGGVVKK